jgi:hypothetical protein
LSAFSEGDEDDESDSDSPAYDDVIEAFEKLTAATAKKHSLKRVEISRIELWQASWFGVRLGGRIVDRWIRSAWRAADDFPDYFYGCARRESTEHGLSWHVELAKAKACPAMKPLNPSSSPRNGARGESVPEPAELDDAAREYLRSIGKGSMIQRLETT